MSGANDKSEDIIKIQLNHLMKIIILLIDVIVLNDEPYAYEIYQVDNLKLLPIVFITLGFTFSYITSKIESFEMDKS